MLKQPYSNPFLDLKPAHLSYQCNEIDRYMRRKDARIQQERFVIFGAGTDGKMIKAILESYHLEIICFCDNNPVKFNQMFCGLQIISPEELRQQYPDVMIAIANQKYPVDILQQLLESGYSKNQILFQDGFIWARYGEQYFDLEDMNLTPDEVFIDAGCYDGETSLEFIKWCSGNYKHIYAFEPEKTNMDRCRKIIEEHQINNITLFQKGLWSSSGKVFFEDGKDSSSKIVETGNSSIEVAAIDDLLLNENVTFIKMDIEGAELEALKGAEKTICKYRPKLAISIYHKLDDIIEIPLYLMEICSSYKFYLRNYTCGPHETVLYGIPDC